MQGRKLYHELAKASFLNAYDHHNDALLLRRRGSRGHACALAVLSLEESAKAYLYKLAAEGVYRIVSKNPNGISTFSESQLFDHRFKHGIITRLVGEALQTLPLRKVMSKTRKRTFTRAQAERLLADLLHEQALQQIRLGSGNRGSQALRRVFELLGTLNDLKNNSLYVGRRSGEISIPKHVSRKVLSEVIELAGQIGEGVGELLDTSLNTEQRKQAATSLREIARAVRVAQARGSRAERSAQGKGEPSASA